jgi:hypothetical protein
LPPLSPKPAERVLVISVMKSGTHLIQELIVALGYGVYGSSRIPPEIRPVFDDETRRRIARMVYDDETFAALTRGDAEVFEKAAAEAWEALGWAWQLRLGMPLQSRYGVTVTNDELIQQALRRTAGSSFAETPAGVCWMGTELDVKKIDGRFVQGWTDADDPKIIFMYRDPRDVVLSMVNFVCGRTAGGFGNFSENLVYNRILCAKPTLGQQLTYALTDPAFPAIGDFQRSLWLLHHPNVCKVSFEELVGARGGGSDDAQLAAVTRIVEFLGMDASPQALTDKLYRPESFTFFKGQIGSWREAFTAEHETLIRSRLGEMIELYGYRS